MEVKLLKSDLKDFLTDSRSFSVYSNHYDNCFHVFQILLYDEDIKEIVHKEYTVKRCEKGFLIKDNYEGEEIFTKDELLFYMDLWIKSQQEPKNYLICKDGKYVQVTEEEFYKYTLDCDSKKV